MIAKSAERGPLFKTGLKLGLFFYILILTSPLGATWRTSNSGTSSDLNAIHFINSDTGWAVGASGVILKTADSGATWNAQTSGVATALQDVQFVNSSTGIIVGSSGLILRTTDAAATWVTANSGVASSLFGVYWAGTSSTVWAVGASGSIRTSIDSGLTWANGDPGASTAQNLRAVFFINLSTGWAVGDSGTLVKTGNAGNTWTTINPGTAQNLRDVYFVDASTGFISGDSGVVLKSTDAGNTWTSAVSTSVNVNGVHMANSLTGWAVGAAGAIFKSTNSGTNFVQETSSTTNTLNDIQSLSVSLAFAVGASGTILKFITAAAAAPFVPTTLDGALTPINNVFDPSLGQSTIIRYYFKRDGKVRLRVFTMQGKLVKTLLDDFRTAGIYEDVNWDGRNGEGEMVASGIYIVQIDAPGFKYIQKIAVVR